MINLLFIVGISMNYRFRIADYLVGLVLLCGAGYILYLAIAQSPRSYTAETPSVSASFVKINGKATIKYFYLVNERKYGGSNFKKSLQNLESGKVCYNPTAPELSELTPKSEKCAYQD
jgi:hypothetical protein